MSVDTKEPDFAALVQLLKELKQDVAEIKLILKSDQTAKMRQSSYPPR